MKEKTLSDLSTFDPMLKDLPVTKNHKSNNQKKTNFPDLKSERIKQRINKDYNG